MTAPDIEPRHLRQALEFAVLMAAEGQKFKPPMAYPSGLKKYFKGNRIPTSALGSIRRMVDGDETFRRRIAAGALPELVDPIGKLWLERPEGWERDIARLVNEADEAAAEADAAQRLKKAEKRRDAAEQAAARSRAEIVTLSDQVDQRNEVIDGLRSDVQKLVDEVAELRAELIDTRNDVRHARDREAAALQKLEAAEQASAEALAKQGAAEHVRDDVLADRAAIATERSELARLAAAASALADQLAAVAMPPRSGQPAPAKRKAMPLPGGVLGSSGAAAEFLMRSGASVLVDGYNVAKQAWPGLDLAGQRVVLLDAVENLVRRYGGDITVVFDGADVVGASADGRRVVRVVFSPEGVTADDVIRDEVRRLPATRHVVVVTNDREILTDTRAMGANLMSSDQMIALMR
ncbi:MAG: NYN domain-containing protein [Ilumatobacteraceae bacterium]|nr:NYN domain-containing protein [Ilumatobacteraceae bacterium]